MTCIGRKLLLQRRVDEEVLSARAALGPGDGHGRILFVRSAEPAEPHGQVRAAQPDDDDHDAVRALIALPPDRPERERCARDAPLVDLEGFRTTRDRERAITGTSPPNRDGGI